MYDFFFFFFLTSTRLSLCEIATGPQWRKKEYIKKKTLPALRGKPPISPISYFFQQPKVYYNHKEKNATTEAQFPKKVTEAALYRRAWL